jgi:rubrerythrin
MSNSKVLGMVLGGCGCLTIIGLLSCGGLLFFGYRAATDSAGPQIDHLFAAIENGTFGDTYETDTTPELRAAASKQQYEEIGDAVATRLGRLKSKSLQSFNVQQHNAESLIDVKYNAEFENGKGTISAKLKREGDQWKFVSFHVNSPVFQQDLATLKCPKCGDPHAAAAKFCPSCGAPLTDNKLNAEALPGDEGEKK